MTTGFPTVNVPVLSKTMQSTYKMPYGSTSKKCLQKGEST
jgi:hypothetical protein